MHQFSLYGRVAKHEYQRTLMQLAGVTRMQPQEVQELRLVFKAHPPFGLNSLPSAGGSQGVQQQDVQRVKTMLNASLYFVQLWSLEFKDTPDAGKQAVSSRMISTIELNGGNPAIFLEQFGYEYVSRHIVLVSEFYDDYATIALRQPVHVPQVQSASEAQNMAGIPSVSDLQLLDPSGGYEVHTFIDVADGNHPELKDRATKQLLALKDTLKQAITLTLGDRLALDTKVLVGARRL